MLKYQKTYRHLALILSMLIFSSSVGWSVDLHYCNGHLKSFSLFGTAKSCHDVSGKTKSCSFHKKLNLEAKRSGQTVHKMTCCKNKRVFLHSDSDLLLQYLSSNDVSLDYLQGIGLLTADIPVNIFSNSTHFNIHDPPPISGQEIRIHFQSFLL